MANSDKDILITPNSGSSTVDPKIEYVGADSSANDTITVETQFDGSKSTLSFEGSAGQLFSVSNDLSGTLFAVNDGSGIPSIEVDSDGEIRLAEFSGNVGIGISTPTELLHVDGRIKANNLTLSSLSGQSSEATSIMIDGSGIIGTRELGSNAFNSTSYLTGNQTITLTGDASGSGTTSISVTVADDSHNHIISNVDGLQTALDGKAPSSTTTTANAALPKAGGTMTGELQVNARLDVGDGSSGETEIRVYKADNNVADHIQFYNGTTRMGEIGAMDTTWLRINQVTNKNIYTPRYIRADNGFFVDDTNKGINGSGNFIGGTITGASDANVANWNTAYTDRNKWDGGSTGLTAATGRASLGLGTAATTASTAYATAAQGALAASAVQPTSNYDVTQRMRFTANDRQTVGIPLQRPLALKVVLKYLIVDRVLMLSCLFMLEVTMLFTLD